MPTDDQQVLVTGTASAPASWTIPGNGQIRPKTVFARYNGTASGTPYVPALKIISDGGELIGIYAAVQPVAAGGSASVTWFPGVEDNVNTAPSGTVSGITSPLSTISVTAPNGPSVALDLPNTGVAAGSYGDASHATQITVDSEGRVTSASQVGISGGPSTIGYEIGYDQVTSTVTVASTTESAGTTVISCAAHTFDGAPVIAEFFCPEGGINASTGANFVVSLFEGSTQIGELCSLENPIGTGLGITAPLIGKLRFTPSAASHTYTVTAFKAGPASVCSLVCGAGGTATPVPMYIRFTKV